MYDCLVKRGIKLVGFLQIIMSNSEAFTQAAAYVKNLTERPTDQELLDLYGYFKQATVGDINIDRPGMFSLDLKGMAKWDNWNSRKGMTKEEAEQAYIQFVDELKKKYPSS